MTTLRYEFWVETRKHEDAPLEQVTDSLRSGSEIAAKRRLEGLLPTLLPGIDFQGVVEEGRYIKDPQDAQETIFEQSGRVWLIRPVSDTIEWVEDFVHEDVESWAVRS